MKKKRSILVICVLILGCASTVSRVNFYRPIMTDLSRGNFNNALLKIDDAKQNKKYAFKDRVLYFLDKGTVLYFQGNHKESNEYLEQAETAMEELFTKSISKAATSLLLNDNALPYYGEVYDNLYVNIFKAINYLQLNRFDDAYVETRRVNIKLRELADKYAEMVKSMNQSDETDVKVQTEELKFYNDALANYLSFLIFRAEGEFDNSRISLQKLQDAWKTYPQIYSNEMPAAIGVYLRRGRGNVYEMLKEQSGYRLNVMAFTGRAPHKKAVGGLITTYEDAVGISDLSVPVALPNIPFPGMKAGYHFKFSLPVLRERNSQISRIEVFVNDKKAGRLQLLEDMGSVAKHTFETKKDIIYFKTIIRTVVKGLAAAEAKKKLRKETGAEGLLGTFMDTMVDVGVDATENADLRCWQTMPDKCYVGEFNVPPGKHDITINFLNNSNLVVQSKTVPNYQIKEEFNFIDAVSLN